MNKQIEKYFQELKTLQMIEGSEGKFLTTKSYKCKLNNGQTITREKVLKNGSDGSASIILPITEDNKVILAVEPRVFTKRTVDVGLPAGYIEPGEDAVVAAKRELLEETGLLCYDFKIVSKNVASSSGLSSEVCTITFAYIDNDTVYKEPMSDGGVIIDRIKVPIKDVKRWLIREQKKGAILSSQTLASLFYLFS